MTDLMVCFIIADCDATELKLIHNALFDPYDQSLWFYHQTLMCTFDPSTASETMTPELSKQERLDYLSREREFLDEVLEDAQDCKWVYQALIECAQLQSKLEEQTLQGRRVDVMYWLQKLVELDPLRKGRWEDLERSLVR